MRIPQYRLEQLSERWFKLQREEMAAELASGGCLVAYGKPLLCFEDIENRLHFDNAAELTKAMQECTTDAEVGGKHIKRILEEIALDLVDEFQDELKASYEHDINRRDVA